MVWWEGEYEHAKPWKLVHKYVPLAIDTQVRFKTSSRYDYDFKKGDRAVIQKVISPYPRATDTIYLVLHEHHNEPMWVTGKDIEEWGQLSITDFERPDDIGEACGASYYEDIIVCLREKGHQGFHRSTSFSWSDKSRLEVKKLTYLDPD